MYKHLPYYCYYTTLTHQKFIYFEIASNYRQKYLGLVKLNKGYFPQIWKKYLKYWCYVWLHISLKISLKISHRSKNQKDDDRIDVETIAVTDAYFVTCSRWSSTEQVEWSCCKYDERPKLPHRNICEDRSRKSSGL